MINDDITEIAPNSRSLFVETGVYEFKRFQQYRDHSYTCQQFKSLLRISRNWNALSCPTREALETILQQVSLIASGDPDSLEPWEAIGDTVELVAQGILSSKLTK